MHVCKDHLARKSRAPRLATVCAFVLLCCALRDCGQRVCHARRHSPPALIRRTTNIRWKKLTIAVDPYDVEDKASIFTVNYRNYGYMPVFFVITNDSDQPISLVGMKAAVEYQGSQQASPRDHGRSVRRLSHPSRNDRQNTLPIPLPKKEVKGGVSRKTWDEIEQAQFGAKAVEPHSTARGFLFFDVSDISNPLAGANFYLTGVQRREGQRVDVF